jgi:hypothetical protein
VDRRVELTPHRRGPLNAPAPPSAALYDPAEHRPLNGDDWTDTGAREAITQIAGDAMDAYRGPTALWPNHPADVDPDAVDRPYRNVYLGAAGIAWALDRLARAGLGPTLAGRDELLATLHDDYLAAPELTELETGTPPPPPSLLFGETGILLALQAIDSSTPRRLRALEACIAANARNPACELCWGSPGTLLAAGALWRHTGETRWRELWRDGAGWLCDEWRERVWVQELYGETRRYVGAGHGFAGKAAVLLADADLLGDDGGDGDGTGAPGEDGARTVARIVRTLAELAVQEDGCAQWPGLADMAIPRRPVQWCHGAPGIVTSLAALPADPQTDALLSAGGELTWRAGPLRKGSGLCHGTAGNALALLALAHRTGQERWLDRARAFAIDAATDVGAWRARHGRGRYSLFTGDIGVALVLAACLTPERPARFPFLQDALSAD